MTQAQATAEARELKATIDRWWRRTRCSIELRSGRGTDPWLVPRKPLRMQHHTATYYRGPSGNLTPSLYICKNGRSDVPGPLCNGYGGYDLVYRIICMGEANHPGLGGPITIDGVYVPQNSARKPTWGTEWEGGYQDYETIPGMLDFMGAVDCALAEYGMLGAARPLTSQMEHKTWAPTRKVDRRGFDRARGICLTQQMFNKYRPGTTTPPTTGDWFDMATEAQLQKVVNSNTAPILVRPKRPDGTIDDQVFLVANDFSQKYWIGDWNAIAVIEYVADLISAGTWKEPHNLPALLIDQVPEMENPVLGFSYKPREDYKERLAALRPQ